MRNALVPLVATGRAARGARSAGRPNADFIAHLIATSTRAPQTCVRRRVSPDEAIAVYRAHEVPPLPSGRSLSRSL